MRQLRMSEFISDNNEMVNRMTENQKGLLNSFLIKTEVFEG